MKTHEVAKILTQLAQTLRRGPNVELAGLDLGVAARRPPNPADIPMALSALAALSQFDKSQWRAVIQEYGLPVAVKNTESTRDIVGKLLRHLEVDPESRRKLTHAAQRKTDVSPELMTALSALLK
jgi:hypothetical protein